GAGTIYLRPNNNNIGGNLIVDNGGLAGTNTPLDASPLRDLQIVGRSSVSSLLESLSVTNLFLSSDSRLQVGGRTGSFSVTVSSNADISGLLTLDNSGSGPGGGLAVISGGGHGGYGGGTPSSPGGIASDS